MTDIASSSLSEIRVSRRGPLYVLLALVAVALGVVAYIVFGLATEKPGEPACDRIAELAAKEPRAARLYDQIVRYVESSVQTLGSNKRVEIRATGNHDRCLEAFAVMARAMTPHSRYQKLVDCVVAAATPGAVTRCF